MGAYRVQGIRCICRGLVLERNEWLRTWNMTWTLGLHGFGTNWVGRLRSTWYLHVSIIPVLTDHGTFPGSNMRREDD